jgi:hypothetical protein
MSTEQQIPQNSAATQPSKKLENGPVEPESKQPESVDLTSYMGGSQIEKIMNSDGPTVKAVLLKADGSSVQIDYDTTPRKHQVKEILGADPTIIGEWHEIQVILVKGRIESLNVPVNEHKLRWPFHVEEVRGDILLYRVDESATPIDFTLEEYKAWAARAGAEDTQKAEAFEKAQEEQQSAEDDDDDKEMLQMDESVMRAQVHNMVRRQFAVKFGREPTEEELETFSQAVLNQFFGSPAEEDNDPDYVPEEDEAGDSEEDDDDEQFDANIDKDASSGDEAPADNNDINTDDASFAAEFASALDGVRALAVADRQKILEKAKAEYEAETGEIADEDTLNQAFNLLKVKLLPSGRIEEEEDESKDVSEDAGDEETGQESPEKVVRDASSAQAQDETEMDAEAEAEEESEAEAEEVALSEEELRKEIAEAFDAVRSRGRFDGAKIAALVSETFYEINGREADSSDIAEVFSRIKAKLAEEAAEELIYDDDSNINYQQPSSVTEQVDAAVATLPTDKAVPELEKREELVAYARTVVTRAMANKARAQFVSLAKREPSVEEFEDLLITLATTRFIDAEFPDDASSDGDYNPTETREQLQAEADQMESGEEQVETDLGDAYAVLGAYDTALSPAKKAPVAFFSPVRTNKTKKIDFNSVDRKLYQRAVSHFRNIHKREPNADEQANLSKFLTTDGLEYAYSDDEEQQTSKPAIAFFSPVRSGKSKKMVDYSILNAKLYERALKHFMAIHKRSPNEEEKANLSKFLTTDGLDYNCTSSDEDDSDYDPSKDASCDVAKDSEACAQFEAEFKSEECPQPQNEEIAADQ